VGPFEFVIIVRWSFAAYSSTVKRNIKKEEHRSKLGYIHIGAIQVLIKATFQEGINSPVELVLKDDRITDPVDKILGVIEGNFAYVKLKFEIHPNIGIPLDTQRLDQTLTLINF
jgi:hypothetical protein